ncbi:hypothetical protein NC653_036119 [Populus alba x Populus x berolinensis]|uniref:Uncharacterized protein n=1 Tax=Populus alba x Populus x berolinensis TaxID=444605 RepID=A0AAD6PUJ6_9ROSI|nr:hypothetical protein NC653_036119 [Populus alba x Populus x berolinensis]
MINYRHAIHISFFSIHVSDIEPPFILIVLVICPISCRSYYNNIIWNKLFSGKKNSDQRKNEETTRACPKHGQANKHSRHARFGCRLHQRPSEAVQDTQRQQSQLQVLKRAETTAKQNCLRCFCTEIQGALGPVLIDLQYQKQNIFVSVGKM